MICEWSGRGGNPERSASGTAGFMSRRDDFVNLAEDDPSINHNQPASRKLLVDDLVL